MVSSSKVIQPQFGKLQTRKQRKSPARPDTPEQNTVTARVPPEAVRLDIYSSCFGLNERPFSLLPDPEFMYWSRSHTKAYSMLEYGILTKAPITFITGEVGTGKTTLLQHLLSSLDDNIKVGLISNTHCSRQELLHWVLMSLDISTPAGGSYVDMFASFQSFLIDQYANGKRTVLIFDEAQNLGAEALEEIRMFTNINSNKDELLQIVLVGQPELREIVLQPSMQQLMQRIAASFHLSGMDENTMREYVAHRLSVTGATQEIFSDHALNIIYEKTQGIPRLVNQLCELSMVYAASANSPIVTAENVEEVLSDGAFFCSAYFAPQVSKE